MVESQQTQIQNLEFLIFNKSGLCLIHADLINNEILPCTSWKLESPSPDQKAIMEKQKLVFGLLWSLKSFSEKVRTYSNLILLQVSPVDLPKWPKLTQAFKNISTPRYKLHALEIGTGIKFILITVPMQADRNETLRQLYQTLYVPLVSSNIFNQPDSRIKSKLFENKTIEFLRR